MKNRLKGNALVGQSGGPTRVINESLVGVIEEVRRHREIRKIYGAVHGIQGVLAQDLIDLKAESASTLALVRKTPSAALGSVRKKPSEADCEAIFQVFQAHDIRYFFYIGGNDSAETAGIIASIAGKKGYDLHICHIPKTIDNDLLVTDHCPGYGSAARFVALTLMGDDLDNRALKGIKINVIMGRNAGFLTAAAALGRAGDDDGPHLVYVPEVPFRLEEFVADVDDCMKRCGRCVVAVSEGIQGADQRPILTSVTAGSAEKDSHGNVALSGTGALGDFLAGHLKEILGVSRVRADTFGYLQRSFPAVVSPVDAREAREVGIYGVRRMTSGGEPSGSVTIHRSRGKSYRVEYRLTPLENVAKNTRSLDREFLDASGKQVSPLFRRYALPLIGELPAIGRLKGKRVAKRSLV
jgi:6-phosphofructokinase 1